MTNLSRFLHQEKEKLPLINRFNFYSKSAEKLKKKMPIEVNESIVGGPLFSNHPIHTMKN